MFDRAVLKIISLAAGILSSVHPGSRTAEIAAIPSALEYARTHVPAGWETLDCPSENNQYTHSFYRLRSPDPSAPVLLCLPGFNTDGGVFRDFTEISEHYTCVAYNFPDHGPYYTGHMSDYTTILDDFCLQQHLDSVVLVGNSLGGMIAIDAAAHSSVIHPLAVVLIASSIPGVSAEKIDRIQWLSKKLLSYPDENLYVLAKRLEHRPGLKRAQSARDGVLKNPAWYREVLTTLATCDERSEAQRIRVPVLCIQGKTDPVIHYADVVAARALFHQSKLISVSRGGHSILTLHGRAIADSLDAFLISKIGRRRG